MYDVYEIRKDFPMFKNHPELVYLDNSATTFKPYPVIEAVTEYLSNSTSNAHRSDYDIAHNVDMKVWETREVVGKLINAEPREIVFTSGTSMSINLLAFGYGVKFLKKGDEILLTEAEHASNVLPWYKVAEMTGAVIKFIPLDEEGRITEENLAKSMSINTKIVSIAHVTNVLGYIADLDMISRVVHQYDAILAVDGAQSVPHLPIDVKKYNIDFLSFSGHKMMGPTGIGVLYGKNELLNKMDPFMTGGGMNSRFDMCGNVSYYNAPEKFEAGTQNLEGIYGLNAAVKYLMKIGLDNVRKHEIEIRKYAIESLKKLDNVILYNEHADAGIITFNIKGVFAQDAATYLNSKGVAVRSGHHCAKLLTNRLGTYSTLRASTYLYTTKEEIDKFVEACKTGGDFLDVYFS